ncbi:DUF2238 domain-containing protein [Clostridium chrysemydis]|uniref:DUF2238 domain-containing protein n=1 Tax=Clostridium chrysemydis TaxID=2665504 RepID=UPI00188482FD|nr:DUF2238 domain-containing protein [Clostridium chrysemydis]
MKKISYDRLITFAFYILLIGTAIFDGIYRDGVKLPRIALIFVTIIGLRILFTQTFLKKSRAMYVAILVFVFLSMYLANVMNFYNIEYYDKMLHFASGFLIAILGFIVFVYLFKDKRNKAIKPISALLFVIMFSASSAAIWEIWEFTTDSLFNLQAQNGLVDTMWDIVLGTLSGVIMSIPIYMYAKGKNIKFIDKIAREILE